jgi:tetratricopeptide (TPR) repeat protein
LKAQGAMLTTPHGAQPANPGASADPAYRFPTPVAPDDNAITSAPLPENDARAMYAQIQVRIPERREAGLKELHTLATMVPLKAGDPKKTEHVQTDARQDDPDKLLPTVAVGNEIAHRVLAWDHIQHGEFDEALPELSDAAILNQHDLWIRYYLSVLKYRMAQAKHTETAGLANMMLDLKAVLEWYPEMADAYDLLALARNEGGGPTAAMQSERAAMNLSPRNERYVYHLAQIYIASKKYEAADALLERLKNSSNPELATLVQEASDKTKTERKYGVPVGATVAKPAPQKSPFDVLEEDAAKRAATERATQSGGPSDKRATKYARGRLVDIDCSQAPAAILVVSTGGSELKLRAANYKSLLLIGADDFSCAWQNREVTVNYKAGGVADGDLVSLEVR